MLYTEAGTKTNDFMSRGWVNDGRSFHFYELHAVSVPKELLFVSKLFCLERAIEPCFEFLSHALIVSSEQIYTAIAWEPDSLFKTSLREMSFAFAGEKLKHLETQINWKVHRSKTLYASTVQRFKLWVHESSVCTTTQSIFCSWRQVNQQMTVRKRRCVSIPAKQPWF